jgi:hypothetical protein
MSFYKNYLAKPNSSRELASSATRWWADIDSVDHTLAETVGNRPDQVG